MKYLISLKNSFRILVGSLKALLQHPALLFPLFIIWGMYIIGAYFYYYNVDYTRFTKENFDFKYGAVLLGTALVINAFVVLFSASILMEIIQQKETGQKINLGRAIIDTFTKNIFKIILLAITWFFLSMLLGVIQWFVKSKISQTANRSRFRTVSVKGVMVNTGDLQNMAGVDSESMLSTLFKGLTRGIRMMCFLIVPAFAWENLGFGKSLSRGTTVLKARINEFISGFVLSSLLKFMIGLPVGIMAYLFYKDGYKFESWQFITVIIYSLFTWSFMIYLEQFFVAELYLWQLKYERACKIATDHGAPIPTLESIDRPSFLDDMPDLMDVGNTEQVTQSFKN